MAERAPAKSRTRSVAADAGGFFGGGDRRTHLEQLRHLSQWSRRVLVVTGPRGVGKSTLYRQLSSSLEPRTKAARINAALVNGPREVLNAMAQGLGLASPADADVGALSELIGSHARQQERAERLCVTLIDDAELLEGRTLDAVIRIAARAPLRIVLFGEARLVPAVQRAAGARSVGWHELRLSGFGVVEAKDYLNWRFRQQGYTEGLPFTDAQVVEIVRLAEGLPGRVDEVANMLLAKMHATSQDNRRRRFPALHQALLAVLVVGIAFAWLVWPTAEDGRAGPSRVETLKVPPVERPGLDPGPEAIAAQAVNPASGVAPPAAEVAEAAAGMAMPAGELAERAAELVQPAAGTTTSAAAVTPAAEGPTAVSDVLENEVPPTGAGGEEETSTQNNVERREVRDAATAGTLDAGGPRGAAWIMSRPTAAFTLQLASFSAAERADAYLEAQTEPGVFARFRQQRNGRILHVVIYGEFATRAAAERAAARLPASAGRVEPWIRSFREVQGAVRTALQP